MAHAVFISYSSKDKILVERVRSALESAHIPCWMAPRDIVPGMEFGDAIIDAIIDTTVFLLILSEHSNKSVQVKRELVAAVEEQKVLLPLRIQEVKLTKHMRYFLGTAHWLDACSRPIDLHLGKLIEAVKGFLLETDLQAGNRNNQSPVAIGASGSKSLSMTQLVEIRHNEVIERVWLFGKSEVTLGKDRDNDIVMRVLPPSSENNAKSLRISRHHAKISLLSEAATWQNLNCSNGTVIGISYTLPAWKSRAMSAGMVVNPAGVLPLECQVYYSPSFSEESLPSLEAVRVKHSTPGRLEQYIIFSAAIKVGAHSGCPLSLTDPSIAEHEFTLSAADNDFWIERLQTQTSVLLDGKEMPKGDRVKLRPGASILLGQTHIAVKPTPA